MKTNLKGFKKKSQSTFGPASDPLTSSFLWEATIPKPLCAGSSISSLWCAPRISYQLLKAMLSWKRRTFSGFCMWGPHSVRIQCNGWKTAETRFLGPVSVSHSLSDSGEITFSETQFSCIKQDPPQCCPRGLAAMTEMFCVCTVHYSSPMCYRVLVKVQAWLRKAHFNFLSFPLT